MPTSANKAQRFFDAIKNRSPLIKLIKNKKANSLPEERIPIGGQDTEATQKRLDYLAQKGIVLPYYTGLADFKETDTLHGNIENFIGFTQMPVGVIGPLNIIGSEAQGDFYIPLATTEGALVASYDRGARACRMAGGVTSVCIAEGVQRSPVFKFDNIALLGEFVSWVLQQKNKFHDLVAQKSNYAALRDVTFAIEGNHLILSFEYTTGDASGQNMVTLCTDNICQWIIANSPVNPKFWFIEGNYSGDKKATALSFSQVRGKKAVAEVEIPFDIVQRVLKTTPQAMAEYWRSSTMGVIQSGAIGAQGHVANGLCALFIATGQDVACVAETSIGVTRMECTENNALYASVTLPNLIVGTVGGGTWLPWQNEGLEMIGCAGKDKARKFAEICCAVALAGEISIAAALSAGHFATAHAKFGRKK